MLGLGGVGGVAAELLAGRAVMARGAAYPLAVVVRVAPGFHINAARPADPNLIPTRLEFAPGPGLAVEGISYPAPQVARLAFSDKPVRVYDGEVVIRARLAVAADAPLGPQRLAARLFFQGCDDNMCMMPQSQDLAVELTVAPAGQEGPALHPRLFGK